MHRINKIVVKFLLTASGIVSAVAQAFTGVQGTIGMVLMVGSGAGAPGNYDLREGLKNWS